MLRRALLALLLAVPLVATGGTAHAAGCTADQVTVVVQYLSGAQDVRCTDGDPSTGLDALTKAKFSWAFHPRQNGFVCRIKNLPAAGQDCMKPKYWAYWHASKPGAAWSYSSEGAGSYNPAPGSVEGWRFDCGAAPGAGTKCAASSPKPSPKPAPAPTPSSKPSAGSSAQAGSGASPSATAKAKASKKAKAKAKAKAKKKKAAAAAPSASSTPSPSSDIANAAASESASPSSEPTSRGSLPWWWGAVALVLIGGTAGAVTVVRRR
jgi:hypothetical protein